MAVPSRQPRTRLRMRVALEFFMVGIGVPQMLKRVHWRKIAGKSQRGKGSGADELSCPFDWRRELEEPVKNGRANEF